LRARRLT